MKSSDYVILAGPAKQCSGYAFFNRKLSSIIGILFFLALSFTAEAQLTYSSRNGGGDWNTNGTWSITGHAGASCGGCRPGALDLVNIGDDDVVTLASGTVSIATLVVDDAAGAGSLTIINAGTAATLNVSGSVTVNSNGTLIVGSTSNGAQQNTLSVGTNLIVDNGDVIIGSTGSRPNVLSVTGNITMSGGAGTFIIGANGNGTNTLNLTGNLSTAAGDDFETAGNAGSTLAINIGGNITNNGTFNLTNSTDQSTFTFTGAGTKTITGTSGTLLVDDMVVNGTVNFGNNTNSRTFTIIDDITINAGATLQSGSTGTVIHTIEFGGDLLNNGTVNLTANSATNQTALFNGTSSIIGSGTYTFYDIRVTGTVNYGNVANIRTVTIVNDLTIDAGATLQSGVTAAVSHTILLGRNLANAGTLNLTANAATNQTFQFNGSVTQTMSGTGATTLRNITMSKTGSTHVAVDKNITVTGVISWTTDGLLIVGSNNNLTLDATASVTAPGTARYIQLDGAVGVNGNLIRITTNAVAPWQFTFPIGTSTGGYTPFTIPTINTAPTNNSTLSVKAITTVNTTGLLKRNFRLVVSGNTNATTFSGGVFSYNDATDISTGNLETDYTTAWWLETGGSWTTVPSSVNTAANTFTVTGGSSTTASLATGTYYYTSGSAIDSHHIWYTYQTGNYSDFNTWTLDPSGTTFDNGLNLSPRFGDEIHILNGFTVTVDQSGQGLAATTIEGGGTLDMAATTGQNIGIITGTGLLRVNGVSLPVGDYTDFVTTNGGTIEYYNTGGNLPTFQTTYNKLRMTNSTGSDITYVLVSNMIVNGTFDLTTTGAGTVTWQINDASNNQRTITLNNNLTVASGGRITVGTGNEGSATPHNITIYGNITNSGIVKFYDPLEESDELPVANYGITYPVPTPNIHTNELQGNAVTVTFSGTTDNTVTCTNTTDFYRFVLNKGTGQQAVLTVNSANTAFFRLFGPSDLGSDAGPGVAPNEYSIDALSIINGTLELTGSINIPILTVATGNEYFSIPQNGALWLNGAGVTVHVGNDDPSHDILGYRLMLSGMIRVTAGTLDGGIGAGIGSEDGGSYFQEGGTVRCWQFRPRNAGTGIFSFTMSGGTFNVGYGYGLGEGYTNNAYARFDLNSANSTFQMSGGILNIAKPTNNSGIFQVLSSSANYTVTGGTINLYAGEETAGNSYTGYVNTTVPLYNLNIFEESATTDPIQLQTNTLVVLNNLTINTGNNPVFATNNLSVTVGGNFNIQTNTTYTPGNGTTTFNGTGAQAWTHNGTITSLASVVMNKASGTLTLAGSQTFPNITTALTLTSGTLADGGKTLTVSGTGTLSNSATHSGAGLINYTSTAATIGGNNGAFSNLTIATSATIATSGSQTITGTLRLTGAATSLNIGVNALTALGNIYSDGTTGVAFGAGKRIITNGLHNAGGLTRQGTAGNILFPVGSGALYTPNTINVTATTHGLITVRPVNSEHPNLTSAANTQAVRYYWRVTSSGYVNITAVTHSSYDYSTTTEDNPTANYRSARFDRNTLTWGTNNATFNATASPPIPSFNTATAWTGVTGTQLDGEYTCGNIAAFGVITAYYSRGTGNWNVNATWSTDPVLKHTGAAATSNPTTCANCPVIIGDGGSNNHTITLVATTVCGTLSLNTGSILNCSTFTGHDFGTNTGSPVSGRGTLRISAVGAGTAVMFPAGDFTSFLGTNGGTVEWYGATKTIPIAGPNVNLNSYYNVILNPDAGATITLPATNLTIYSDLTQGSAVGFTGSVITNGSRTIGIIGNLNITRGTFSFSNANPSVTNMTVDGNTTVGSGAIFAVVGGGTANTNTFSTAGSITNNGTLSFRNNGVVNLTFTGTNNVNFTGTGSVAAFPLGTTLNLVTVNKGNSKTPTVAFNVGGTVNAPVSGWLTLTNGTFDFNNTGPHVIVSATATYPIPPTAKLKVSSGTVNILNTANDAADLLLNGELEVAGGTVNIAGGTNGNDIEYASAGTPTITVSGGALNVNGSIRRSTSTITGALVYNQTGGTVTVGGRASNTTRGVFEIDANTGSSFTLTGASSVLNIQRQTGGTGYADVFINPITSNVSSNSTISVGLGSASTQNNFRINIAPSVGNLTIQNGSGTNAQTVNMFSNPLTLTGTLTIPTPSVLVTNSLDVTIAGDMTVTGTYTGGTNTTTFNGTGPQAATLSASSTFNNLTVSKTAGTTLTLSGTSPTLNNLNILTGILDVGSFALDVRRDIVNNSSQLGAGSVRIFSTTANTNSITSSGGSFTNLTLGGTATSKTVNVSGNLTINGTLNFSTANRYLMIGSSELTFGASAPAVSGAGSTAFIRTNGVSSDLGVTKIWNGGATNTFVYQIGTSANYTPVSFSLNVSTTGTLTVAPVNSAHVTHNQASAEQILNYYWSVRRGGTLAATASGSHTYSYPSTLITGSGGGLVAAYLNVANPVGWTTTLHGGSATTTQMTFTSTPTTNIPVAGSSYDYSVGTVNTLPNPIVPLYSRLGVAAVANLNVGGSWTTASNWTTETDGDPDNSNPTSISGVVPAGVPVVILNGTRINTASNGRRAFRTTIGGLLSNGTTTGHNLGIIEGTGTFRTAINTFPAGDYTAFVSATGGTIEYVAPMTMSNRSTYNNLSIFSGSAGTVVMTNTDLTLNGDMVIPSGTTVDNANNRNITIAGDWTSAGSFSPGSGTVIFNGSAAQVIDGTTTFNGLTVSKTNNLTLGTGTLTTVNGTLTLTNGHIIPSVAHPLKLGASSSVAGGSSTSFIANRALRDINVAGNATVPIGNIAAGYYRPVGLANTGAFAEWDVTYVPNDPGLGGYPNETMNTANLGTVSGFEYWLISRTPAVASADVTLSYSTGSYDGSIGNVGVMANLRVAHWDGAQWDLPPGGGTFSQSGTDITGTVTVTNVTSFSPLTLASLDLNSPLPVDWIFFKANRESNTIVLNWKTAHEFNNEKFEIERSSDGLQFNRIGTVLSKGDNSLPQEYDFIDSEVSLYSRYYYRIRQVDFDGQSGYSEVVAVVGQGEAPQYWTVYPNPVNANQSLSMKPMDPGMLSGEVQVTLISMNGVILYRSEGQLEDLNTQMESQFRNAGSGIYILQISDGSHREIFKVTRH